MLCDVCASLSFQELLNPVIAKGRDPAVYKAEHHASSAALRAAAASGCELCSVILAADHDEVGAWDTNTLHIATHEMGPFEMVSTKFGCHHDYAPVSAACGAVQHQSTRSNDSTIRYLLPSVLKGEAHYLNSRKRRDEPDTDLWRSWLAHCDDRHPLCSSCPSSHTTILPTRVLDIGQSPDSVVKLFESGGGLGRYVALSHRWGLTPPLMTTVDNHHRHLNAIEDLPLTFADAVAVTRALGLRYLWVDSLCIIQDNERDWQRESALMAKVYSNAALTIAAAAAMDASEGLFRRIEIAETEPASCTVYAGPQDTVEELVVKLTPGSRATPWPAQTPGATPLAQRAWALQERLLSTRTLGFGNNGQCYFECQEAYCDEAMRYPVGPYFPSFSLDTRHCTTPKPGEPYTELEKARPNWYAILEEYSNCYVTEGKDRLPALSGIAQVFSSRFGGPYSAGVWDVDLSFGLAWACKGQYPQDRRRCVREPRYQAPSWSWAACDRPLTYPLKTAISRSKADWRSTCNTSDLLAGLDFSRSPTVWVPCLDVDATGVDLVDAKNTFGEVMGGRVTVSGLVRPYTVRPLQRQTGTHNLPPQSIQGDFFDRGEPDIDSCKEYAALLLGFLVTVGGVVSEYSLLLSAAGPERQTFKRVGAADRIVVKQNGMNIPYQLTGGYKQIHII